MTAPLPPPANGNVGKVLAEETDRPGQPERPSRDQDETAFTSILRELLGRLPAARGAALVDVDGETVDYAGGIDSFELRVSAAQWRIVFDEAERQPSLAGMRWILVRASRSSVLVHALPERYALVVSLTRAARLAGWSPAIDACRTALAKEAGWGEGGSVDRREQPSWLPIDVVCDARLRPHSVRIAGLLRPVEVLGALVGSVWTMGSEPGWRVRFDTTVEAMLVRDSGGAWYVDEPVDPPAKPSTSAKRRRAWPAPPKSR